MSRILFIAYGWLCLAFAATLADEPNWKPAPAPLMTSWAKDVSPDRVLPDYPRPQLVRPEWQNLNGLWNLEDDRQILVPFPIESALSGVGQHTAKFACSREFTVPKQWLGKRVRLNFGAVDWKANVWVNSTKVGEHLGGYDQFSFDITDALKDGPQQQIKVLVSDPTDSGSQPHGKQHLNPEGIWYTPTTGIWQTVWKQVGGKQDNNFNYSQLVVRDPAYLHANFQFRFQAFARLSGQFDMWHIDYVYLNKGRRTADQFVRDVVFIFP